MLGRPREIYRVVGNQIADGNCSRASPESWLVNELQFNPHGMPWNLAAFVL